MLAICAIRNINHRLSGMAGIPDRVLSLIGASGQSRRAFAQDIGLDDSKLSKSLSGVRRFSSLDLSRIADKCGVSVDWLVTGEEPGIMAAATTIRGETDPALDAAKRYGTIRRDLATLGWEQPWRPVDRQASCGTDAQQGEALAGAALARVSDAGFSVKEASLPALIENTFGIDVAVVPPAGEFDGLAVSLYEQVRLVVLGTSQVPARQRFALAHELGHLLAGDAPGVHLDKNVYDQSRAKDASETRANAFAAAFLMPEPVLRKAAGPAGLAEDEFARLACDLQVSPWVLAIRLRQLHLIGPETCRRFRKISAARASSMAGRSQEFAKRVAEASLGRHPGLLVRDAYMAYETGATTLRLYASLLGVDRDELRRSLETREGD